MNFVLTESLLRWKDKPSISSQWIFIHTTSKFSYYMTILEKKEVQIGIILVVNNNNNK